MNKELKKAAAILEEKQAKNREKLEKAEAELKETREKLEAVTATMNAAESAEEYKAHLKEKNELEAVLEFCEKKVKEAKASGLTKAEYNALHAEANRAFSAIKKDKYTEIKAEAEKLVKLLTAYDEDVKELNSIVARAAAICGATPTIYNSYDIAGDSELLKQFITSFYRQQTAAAVLKQGIKI